MRLTNGDEEQMYLPYKATIKENEWRNRYPLDTLGAHLGNKYPAIISEVNRKQNSVVLQLKAES